MAPVFLVGFMGSGKTTLGRKLAAKLHLTFCDLDEEIVAIAGMPISNIVEQYGMAHFRELERQTLHGLQLNGKLVATGGGCPCFFNNMDYMLQTGTVVYLKATPEFLQSRLLQTNLNERPLLKDLDKEGLLNYITQTLAERALFYDKAQVHFPVPNGRVEELIAQLSHSR